MSCVAQMAIHAYYNQPNIFVPLEVAVLIWQWKSMAKTAQLSQHHENDFGQQGGSSRDIIWQPCLERGLSTALIHGWLVRVCDEYAPSQKTFLNWKRGIYSWKRCRIDRERLKGKWTWYHQQVLTTRKTWFSTTDVSHFSTWRWKVIGLFFRIRFAPKVISHPLSYQTSPLRGRCAATF